MKSAIVYCRVSTKKQDTDGDSLERQEKACLDYCKSHNIKVIGVYKEKFTGKTTKRPIIEEATNVAQLNHVEYFIVFDIDRFSREGYAKYSEMKELLSESGIKLQDTKNVIGDKRLVISNDMIDMSQYKWNKENPSEMAEMVYSAQANIEGKKILQRTIPKEILLEQKGFHVRQSNFGYRNKKIKTSDGKVVIQEKDPIEGDLVIEMFELRASCQYSDSKICDILTSKGFKKRSEDMISISYLQRLIKNPIYAGVLCHKWNGGNTIKTAYQGLISIDLFNRANRGNIYIEEYENGDVQIKYRKKNEISEQPIIEKRKNYNSEYPYSRVLRCPECSGYLTPNKSQSRNGCYHHYYQCNGKKGDEGIIKHKNYSIIRDKANSDIYDFLNKIEPLNSIIESLEYISDIYFENKNKSDVDKKYISENQIKDINKKKQQIENSISKFRLP